MLTLFSAIDHHRKFPTMGGGRENQHQYVTTLEYNIQHHGKEWVLFKQNADMQNRTFTMFSRMTQSLMWRHKLSKENILEYDVQILGTKSESRI